MLSEHAGGGTGMLPVLLVRQRSVMSKSTGETLEAPGANCPTEGPATDVLSEHAGCGTGMLPVLLVRQRSLMSKSTGETPVAPGVERSHPRTCSPPSQWPLCCTPLPANAATARPPLGSESRHPRQVARNGFSVRDPSDTIPNSRPHAAAGSAAKFNCVLSVIAARRHDKTLHVRMKEMNPEIQLIRDKSSLEGTAYFEFLPGRYANKHWNDGSVFMDEEIMCLIERPFMDALPDYDHYAFCDVSRARWGEVIRHLDAFRDKLSAAQGPGDVTREFCRVWAGTKESFTRDFENNRKKLIDLIVEFTAWVQEVLGEHESIAVLGM